MGPVELVLRGFCYGCLAVLIVKLAVWLKLF